MNAKQNNKIDMIENIFRANKFDKHEDSFQITSRRYLRVATFYNVKELLKQLIDCQEDKFILPNDYIINSQSLRYKTFYNNLKCVNCGLEGKFLALERSLHGIYKMPKNKKGFHLNLYSIDEYGREILMTKDHIYPKSKGGLDIIDNMQTMCYKCNMKKADYVELDNND